MVLHQFLDKTQGRLIELADAILETYCRWQDETPA